MRYSGRDIPSWVRRKGLSSVMIVRQYGDYVAFYDCIPDGKVVLQAKELLKESMRMVADARNGYIVKTQYVIKIKRLTGDPLDEYRSTIGIKSLIAESEEE